MLDLLSTTLLAILSWATLAPLAFHFGVGCGCGCCKHPFSAIDLTGEPCTACKRCTYAYEYEVMIAGVTNDTCGSCGSLNATYILPNVAASCCHRLTYTGPCGVVLLEACIDVFEEDHDLWATGVYLDVAFKTTTKYADWFKPPQYAAGEFTHGIPFDCDWQAVSVNFFQNSGIGCNFAGSTATVTAVAP